MKLDETEVSDGGLGSQILFVFLFSNIRSLLISLFQNLSTQ